MSVSVEPKASQIYPGSLEFPYEGGKDSSSDSVSNLDHNPKNTL